MAESFLLLVHASSVYMDVIFREGRNYFLVSDILAITWLHVVKHLLSYPSHYIITILTKFPQLAIHHTTMTLASYSLTIW